MRGPPPESCAEIRFANWFSQYNIPVWHNRKDKIIQNKNVFSVKGTRKMPHLVIKTKTYPIEGYIALEIIPAIKSRSVADSLKIIRYSPTISRQRISLMTKTNQDKSLCDFSYH